MTNHRTRILLVAAIAALAAVACSPSPTTPPPTTVPRVVVDEGPAAWVQDSLRGWPNLQAEMTTTSNVWSKDPAFEWGAMAYHDRIEWNVLAPTWDPAFLDDLAVHESAHVLAYHRWFVAYPPGWPTNGVSAAEDYADCLASYLQAETVRAHGGCVGGTPAEAYRLLVESPPVFA